MPKKKRGNDIYHDFTFTIMLDILKKVEKGTPQRRCMTCKYWNPETEVTGKCMRARNPIYKLPNYVCKNWEPFNGK